MTVLWFTVLGRSKEYHIAQLDLFWSYRKLFKGDMGLGKEIMANLAMFIPFGFLPTAALTFSKWSLHKRAVSFFAVILAAFAFSLTIETLQLFLMRGLFELDDLVSNTAGAVIGIALFLAIERLAAEKHRTIIATWIGAAFMIACLAVYIGERGDIGVEMGITTGEYCFQIDDAVLEDNSIQLTGFAFRYEYPTDIFSLFLQSAETGERVELETEYGLPRRDVNGYFLCEYDYTNVGFTASAEIDIAEEYEVMVKWPWSPPLPTGVFVTGADIHYFPEEIFSGPDLDAPFVTDGIPRVYRPDYSCWVYQYEDALYWIADEGFNFEDDRTTYIQYQTWTTQIENLPEDRLAQNNLWDNIGGYFEEYELDRDYGGYRVMKREIPAAYSVTSIVTGYYKNGEWIWENYFRPIYEIETPEKRQAE